MDNNTCQECQEGFKNLASLHKHLKVHDLSLGSYYHKFYLRRDFYSGDPIIFKSYEQYFKSRFNSKTNFRKYFSTLIDNKEREDLCRTILRERKDEKGLRYNICQLESRSFDCPPVTTMTKVFEDYNKEGEAIGLTPRFDYDIDLSFFKNGRTNKNFCIYYDSREQRPLALNRQTRVNTLKYGDYCTSNFNKKLKVFIERKSLSDLIGTISGGYQRFKQEIFHASSNNAYLVVLVEAPFREAMHFDQNAQLSSKIKAKPHFIFHRIRELIQKYINLQFLFVKDRAAASAAVENILEHEDAIQYVDLQYAYDTNNL